MNIMLRPRFARPIHGMLRPQRRSPAIIIDGEADSAHKAQRLRGAAIERVPVEDDCLTPAEPHLLRRAVRSVGAFLSIIVAAYAASNRYRQLAKVPRAELERRGIARGDLITEVSRILLERK